MLRKNLCVIFVFLNCVFAKIHVPFFLGNQVCDSLDCKDIGYNIFSSINISKNPCDNFYDFSCGNWISTNNKPTFEPIWNHHLQVGHKINHKIQTILKNTKPTKNNNAISKTVQFYKACMDVENDVEKGDQHVKDLKELLGNFAKIKSNNMEDLLLEIAKITKYLKIYPLLKMSVNIDYKNTTNHVIYIEPGTLVYPLNILLAPSENPVELNTYRHWIYESFLHVYNIKNVKVTRIIDFEIRLAKIMKKVRMERTTVDELSKKTHVNFLKIFEFLYGQVTRNNIVIVKNFYYLRSLILLIKRTDIKTIENYLLWTIIKDLSRETTKYMRNLNFIVDKAVLGIESDLSRKVECTNKIKEHFGFAIIPDYLKLYFNDDTIKNIKEMIKNIKNEFIRLLGENAWLSDETKLLSIEKVNSIKEFVGFPEEFQNVNNIESFYDEYNITDDHFYNMLNIKRILSQKELQKLKDNANDIQWPSHVFEVNAYYSILQNSIFIPLGLLEPPFYYKNAPNYINYGSLGSLIGHELSHSLDSTGRQANKNGIISQWWPKSDITQFQSNTRCFINQYNKFNSNGFITVGENIADNVGLRIALNALKKLEESNPGPMMPFLEIYSGYQVFFISFSQIWCEISNREDLFNEEHSSVKNRVNGTLSNSKSFYTYFNCKNTSVDKKCTLW